MGLLLALLCFIGQVGAHEPPEAREYSSLVSIDPYLFVFGGRTEEGLQNDVHFMDTRSLEWSGALHRPWCCVDSQPMNSVGQAPSKRYMHTGSAVGSRMYIFGGDSSLGLLNDVHVFEAASMSWYGEATVVGDQPVERRGHAAAVVGTQIYIFGGEGINGWLSDLHVLDTGGLTWSQPRASGTPPPHLSFFTLSALPTSSFSSPFLLDGGRALAGRLLLIGGAHQNNPERCSEVVYQYDTATSAWSILSTEGPSPWPRSSHAAAVLNTNAGAQSSDEALPGPLLMVWGGRPGKGVYAPSAGGGGSGVDNSGNFTDVHVFRTDTNTWSGELYLYQRPAPRLAAVTATAGQLVYMYGGWEGGRLVNRVDVYVAGKDAIRDRDLVVWSYVVEPS